MEELESSIEYVSAGRADRKPVSESNHRSRHKRLDHKIDGTTHGRRRERGEDPPALSASWTYFEYMKELLLAIIYHNTEADASHLLTAEMRRDGVAPNRAAIHAWAVKKGYVAHVACNTELLRIKLLPTIKAAVQESGIVLLRPDRGEKRELICAAKFGGKRMLELKWSARVRRSGTFDIEVHYDPTDLQKVWFCDLEGPHEFRNLSRDPILVNEATFQDVIAIQDDDHLQDLITQSESDQAASNVVAGRAQQNDSNRSRKKAAIKESGRRISKAELTSNIYENRLREMKHLAGMLDPVSRAPHDVESDQDPTEPLDAATCANDGAFGTPDASDDPMDEALAKFRREREASDHD